MPKLIVLVGPPGSGKTTFSTKDLQKNDNEAQFFRISQDEQGKSQHLHNFKEGLKDKNNIVIDRLNFNKEQRKRYIEPAKKAGYETSIIVLHESYETCFKRCNARDDHPTITNEEHARSALGMFFNKYERPTSDEADNIEFRYPKQNLKMSTIIFDIDNTLSNANHREHFLQGPKKNWTGFFENMDKDPVNEWCKRIITSFRNGSYQTIITLCSGRPDNYKPTTKKWLEENKILYDNLFMRPRSDSRKDSIVKEIIMDFEILTRYSDILFCIDDRDQVIQMYRNRGLVVLDCAGNKF